MKYGSACRGLALASVLGIGTSSFADTSSVRYGQGACNYSTDKNTSTGRSFEFYGEVDTAKDDATVGFRYVIEFQKPVTRVDPCVGMQRIATQRMQLDLEKQRLELELLRAKVAREQQEAKEAPVDASRLDDDW